MPALASPFLAPEFTDIVGAARTDVRVAIISDSGAAKGFFPFQRSRSGFGRPVGGRLSDQQCVVIEPSTDWSLQPLLEEARLHAYSFDHLVPIHPQLAPFISTLDASPVLDLSHGFHAYREDVRTAGLGGAHEAEVKRRRLERRMGELRFELHETDPRALDALIRWKSSQYRRTTGFDPLSLHWVREVIERVHASRGETFCGVLSSLYVGDRLAALHLGLRSRTFLASWMPAFDVQLSKYSPGLVLLLMLAEAAAADGVELFDLGKGPEPYKKRFTTREIDVAVGAVPRHRLAAAELRLSNAAWNVVLRSPLYGRAHRVRRRLQFR